MKYQFQHITACGTFDHLHVGHEEFLKRAFEMGKQVHIGITSTGLIKNKRFGLAMQDYSTRVNNVKIFLKKYKLSGRANLFELKNMYGIAVQNNLLEGIVVTKETVGNARLINQARIPLGLRPLSFIYVDFIKNNTRIIRSTHIRGGSIDRLGNSYDQLFTRSFQLQQQLRSHMQKPLGELIMSNQHHSPQQKIKDYVQAHSPPIFAAVGDIVNQTMKDVGLPANLQIIDFKNKRKKIDLTNSNQKSKVRNMPGFISTRAATKIKQSIAQYLQTARNQQVIIQGEEDLLVIPTLLLLPLNSILIYGQPEQGIVLITVSELMKQKMIDYLHQYFEV